MKKLLLTLSLIGCIFAFGSCSNGGTEINMNNENNNTQQQEQGNDDTQQQEEVEPISSLVGTWKETDGKINYKIWYEAIITNNSIELYYCDWNNVRTLYWKGTYSDPESPVKDWSFRSNNTDYKPGAAEYRDFKYTNGALIPERIIGEPAGCSPDNLIYLHKIS